MLVLIEVIVVKNLTSLLPAGASLGVPVLSIRDFLFSKASIDAKVTGVQLRKMFMCPNPAVNFRKACSGFLWQRRSIHGAAWGQFSSSFVDTRAPQKTVSRFNVTMFFPLSSGEIRETCYHEHALSIPFWHRVASVETQIFLIYLGWRLFWIYVLSSSTSTGL